MPTMMKIAHLALLSTIVVSAAAADDSSAAAAIAGDADQNERRLDCWNGPAERKWHPQYQLGWTEGYCRNTRDCDSPGYDTELACCKGSYLNQASGKCLASLPEPPTQSPTGSGGLDVWYPDYDKAWPEAGCINERPLPSGRPTYDDMLSCCKGAYGGQVSGKCLASLPFPPTQSPTGSGGLDVWYPDYDTAWSDAHCINERPMPSGRPTYDSMLACCKGAYGGQVSGKCLAELPFPPTQSPTGSGGLDVYYPKPGVAWTEGYCINERPFPNNVGQPYDDMLACCKGAFRGQVSGKCLAELPYPPTQSPTATGGLDVYYPKPGVAWNVGYCTNERPFPNNVGQGYDDVLACCKGAFGGQVSGKCLAELPYPPTSSPTASGGLDVWYPKPGAAWTEGYCVNERPFPNNVGQGFDTQEECCNTAYGSQASNDCMCKVDPCYSCNCGSLSQLGNGGCLEGADGQSGANGDLDCGQNDSD